MNIIVLYGLVKFLAYTAWGYIGYRLYEPQEHISISDGIAAGFARWMIGLGFGVLLFVLVRPPSREDVWLIYFAVYTPVRFLEWGITGNIFYKSWPDKWRSGRFYFWIIAGIGISFLSDLVSPEMIQEGRFCVGRCLC